ncbi:abortive infection family protein [Pseudomonas cichorii]|nr:abortive infection family protein [Pseudomonas cichorii]MBX8508911.1 abortive infection family protein [Pseudomonas cichorii]MBX8524474.1 abortive infection family protein [Pseudomonas cichorii]
MSSDGISELATRSAKVRSEHRLLLEGLKSFEKKLVDLVSGLGCGGNSVSVVFEQFTDSDGDPIAHSEGYLYFSGNQLIVISKSDPQSWGGTQWQQHALEAVGPEWQRRLSDQNVLDSLVADILKNLDDEYKSTAEMNKSLSQFVTVEKAEIDSDLDEFFGRSPSLLDSWMKARNSILGDPEESITRSCSHVETVLKGCLKALGASEYETLTIEKLMRKTLHALKANSTIDSATAEMLQGAVSMSKAIGETRNFKSSSHGKNDGYVPPKSDLAQLVNHLAGVISVFVMKQTQMNQVDPEAK